MVVDSESNRPCDGGCGLGSLGAWSFAFLALKMHEKLESTDCFLNTSTNIQHLSQVAVVTAMQIVAAAGAGVAGVAEVAAAGVAAVGVWKHA